jgi:hypothetical protein
MEQKNQCGVRNVEFKCVEINNETAIILKTERALNFELYGLTPYTDYKCYARVANDGIISDNSTFSPSSDERSFRTREGST